MEVLIMKKRSLLLFLMVLSLVLPLVGADAATYYYVGGTSSLRLRESPDQSGKILASYAADYAVVSFKKYNSTWAYVHFSDGAEGYVMRKFLKSSSSATMYVTKDDTPLRSGPSTARTQTGTMFQGDKVKVITKGAVWSYVSGTAGTGYVKKSLLSSTKVKKSGNASVPYTAYVTNKTGRTVNVRKGPGKEYAVDAELEPGTAVYVVRIQGNWSEITSPVSGYMMSSYLTKTAPDPTDTPEPGSTATPAPKASKATRYITSPNGKSVNVRRGPSEKGYAVAIALPVGTKVTVISTENGWSKISSSAMLGNGYVKTKYLTSQKPGTTPTPKPGETAKPTATPFASYKAKVVNPNGNKVNLRKGAGMGYATITQLEPGTSLTVIGEKGDWFNVKYGSTTGYMKKEYVAKK